MTDPPYRRFRWQFGLRTLLLLVAVTAIGALCGAHYWRMSVRAKEHLAEVDRLLAWQASMVRVTFHMPSQYWKAAATDRDWHLEKANACLNARWAPWRRVDESDLPPLEEGEPGWPDWNSPWRAAHK